MLIHSEMQYLANQHAQQPRSRSRCVHNSLLLDDYCSSHTSTRAADTRLPQGAYLSQTVAFLHRRGTNPVIRATGRIDVDWYPGKCSNVILATN